MCKSIGFYTSIALILIWLKEGLNKVFFCSFKTPNDGVKMTFVASKTEPSNADTVILFSQQ